MFSVLKTRSQWSSNTYMQFLKEADDSEHLVKDYMGQRLVYGDRHIICENNAFLLRKNKSENENEEEIIDTVNIPQNEEGMDIEDRIIMLKKYISTLK